MDKLCGNCRHWGTPEDAIAGEPFRACQAIRHSGGDAGYRSSLAGTMRRDNPGAIVGTMDGSDYASALVASGDFGCVLWEGKETA